MCVLRYYAESMTLPTCCVCPIHLKSCTNICLVWLTRTPHVNCRSPPIHASISTPMCLHSMHEAAFAYWPGTIDPNTRSSEVVSSLDLVPTLSALAGVALPTDRVYDGKDMSHILTDNTGTAKSLHEFLFFYGGCAQSGPSAVRHGRYKVYYARNRVRVGVKRMFGGVGIGGTPWNAFHLSLPG